MNQRTNKYRLFKGNGNRVVITTMFCSSDSQSTTPDHYYHITQLFTLIYITPNYRNIDCIFGQADTRTTWHKQVSFITASCPVTNCCLVNVLFSAPWHKWRHDSVLCTVTVGFEDSKHYICEVWRLAFNNFRVRTKVCESEGSCEKT